MYVFMQYGEFEPAILLSISVPSCALAQSIYMLYTENLTLHRIKRENGSKTSVKHVAGK